MSKKTVISKKLVLAKETVRTLNREELERAVAAGPYPTPLCTYTCV